MKHFHSNHQKDKRVAVFDMLVAGISRVVSKSFSRALNLRPRLTRQQAADELKRFRALLKLGQEAHFRQAIIEADSLLDQALKSRGALGKSLGERLKNFEHKMSPANYQAAWQAHKLRNRLVHESGVQLLSFQAQKALRDFERAIFNLIH